MTYALRSFFGHRTLLWELWQRDFHARYKSGLMGVGWAVLNPLLMLALYSFVFVYVFKIRWGTEENASGDFVVMLFVGLLAHGFFAEFITRAPLLVAGNPSYVKKVVFPLELLPMVPLLGCLVNFMIGLVLVEAMVFYSEANIPLTILFLPLIILPYIFIILGISYFLSSVGVYLRDISHIVGLVTTVAMFASPILYPIENVPEPVRPWLNLNPLTLVVEQLRAVCVEGIAPDLVSLAWLYGVAAICFAAGFAWFQATRRGFADVL